MKKIIDYIVIIIGIMTLILMLTNYDSDSKYLDYLSFVATIVCLLYVSYVIYLYIFRPRFDWHLLKGGFLRKLTIFVLLTPFLLATCIRITPITSPKELVCEDVLYESKIDSVSLKQNQDDPSLYWSVYYHFIDPGNQHMTATTCGRGWAGFIAILGVFLLNGLLVSSIVGWIDIRKERWLKGEVRYNNFLKLIRKNGLYVIIGGNDMVAGIVSQIFDTINATHSVFKPYILIQTSRDVESFRRELFSTLTEKQQQRVIIYYGNRNSEKDIEDLYLCKAKEIYILGEETRTDDMESYHDTMNMKCLGLINGYLKKSNFSLSAKDVKPKCYVMFEYQTTFSVFQFCDIDNVIDFRPFNYYEMWAQKVLISREIDPQELQDKHSMGGYLPLEGYCGIEEGDSDYVHLFIVGMSRMGVAMAIETAHLAHYPNYTEQNKIRTKITFIDKNAIEEKDFFMGRFKELFSLSHSRYGVISDAGTLEWHEHQISPDTDYLGGDFIDIEWEFINAGIEHTVVQNYILAATKGNARISIAICLPESNRSHASALYLNKKIYEAESVLQVLVYNRYGNSIINSLHSGEERYPYMNKLKSFGSNDKCFDRGWIDQIYQIGEEIGGRYQEICDLYIKPAKAKAGQVDTKCKCKCKGKSDVAKSWSNIYNGNMLWTKLRSVGYRGCPLFPGQVTILADVEHNRWNMEQLLMNFRPLTKEEQTEVIEGKKDKEELKGRMAHLNICSNRRLAELRCVDVVARAYDEGLTNKLTEIYAQLMKNE